MSYKNIAKQGLEDVMESVKPQAEKYNDKESLNLIEAIKEDVDNDKPMSAVKKLRELKLKAEEEGYTVAQVNTDV